MFEKEAEEYLKKDGTKAEQILDMLNEISPLKITLKQVPFILAMIQQVFKDGAEFGYNKCNEQLTKAKEIIKDYLTIAKGAHTAVCGVSEENRTINVLKLNEEAEQLLRSKL